MIELIDPQKNWSKNSLNSAHALDQKSSQWRHWEKTLAMKKKSVLRVFKVLQKNLEVSPSSSKSEKSRRISTRKTQVSKNVGIWRVRLKRRRKDLFYKSALRKLRRFYKSIFKAQNLDVVRRRYINCSTEYLYESMLLTLQSMISEEYLTEDLVYFTIGITGLRKPSDLPCTLHIRQEISEIVNWASTFSVIKFQRWLSSESFQTLLHNVAETSNASWARDLLDEMNLD